MKTRTTIYNLKRTENDKRLDKFTNIPMIYALHNRALASVKLGFYRRHFSIAYECDTIGWSFLYPLQQTGLFIYDGN